MSDLISIIVPIYNTEAYLEKCIESIRRQTYLNIEIILIDDGSTDGSAQICDKQAKLDERIVVIHKENAGVSAARNTGIAAAKGKYIGCVDSDDWIEPDMYERMYQACEQMQVPMAMCRYARISEAGIVKSGTNEIMSLSQKELFKYYICGSEEVVVNNCVWSKLFLKDLITDISFADGRVSEDIMYTTKLLAKVERAAYIDSCLYNYKEDRVGSIMNSDKVHRVIQDEIPFWKEHIAYIRENVSDALGDYAEFYFYRRLLSYYTELIKVTETKELAGWISDVMYEDKKVIRRVYTQEYISRADKMRMRVFLISPCLYRCYHRVYLWIAHMIKK